MGKRRKSKQSRPVADVYGSDDERAYEREKIPDPQSEEFYQDEVDQFHTKNEKMLLDTGAAVDTGDGSSEEEEVYKVGMDDDEAENDAEYKLMAKRLHAIRSHGFKDDLASDLEDAEETDAADEKAWGRSKARFYGGQEEEKEDLSDSEPGASDLEEEEVLAVQRRLTAQLDDADVGLELFQPSKKTDDARQQKITKDLSKLSRREKMQLLKKESPELMELQVEFTSKLTKVKDVLLPVSALIKSGRLPASSAALYVNTMIRLYLNYCTNISFYMMLKSKRCTVEHHPVIHRLVQYRNLIKQLELVDDQVEPQLEDLVKKINSGHKFPVLSLEQQQQQQQQQLSAAVGKKTKQSRKNIKEKGRPSAQEEEEEKGQPEEEVEEEDVDMKDEEEEEEEEEGDGRRAVNYEIVKNRGLTPRRRKELRNPRVKHKMKYRKAKIRRRGQIAEVRTEMHRYGGEISGIRAGIKRTTRLT